MRGSTLLALWLAGAALTPGLVGAQNERWFTFEVSIFSNENPADRLQEPPLQLQPEELGLARARRLTQLIDLLSIPDPLFAEAAEPGARIEVDPAEAIVPPQPLAAGVSPFRFADLKREAFIALPASESDFQQTNRALERSPDYRLLYHGIWRAPLADEGESVPLAIEGGLSSGGGQELSGTLDLHFNARRDRIVLDTSLALSEGSAGVHLHRQSREMRSDEFHYLDSPALGVIFIAQPYEPPALPQDEPPKADKR